MTRSPISGPKISSNAPRVDPDGVPTQRQEQPQSRTSKSKDKAKLDKIKSPKPKPQHTPKAPGGGASAAAHHDGEEGAQGVGGVEGRDSQHVQRHEGPDTDALKGEEEVAEHEEGHETAATGGNAVKRAKGGNTGGGDGFEGGQDQREAYERWMRGRVDADQERIAKLKQRGAKDDFNANRTPLEVEALGTPRAVAHLVRLYETWALAGVSRDDAIQNAASFLAGFSGAQNIRKVLADLESNPIRDVYPLEVLMKLLDERPELLPGVRGGQVVHNAEQLDAGTQVFAGHAIRLEVPRDVRIKSFALLGGGRPGYEFHPHKDEGAFQLLVDTPGRFTFALLAAPLQQLGRIQRETNEAILEVLSVTVHAMGKKGGPISLEEWSAQQAELREAEVAEAGFEDDDDGDGHDARVVATAPSLAVQVRTALDAITRDAATTSGTTTYSWTTAFFQPRAALEDEPLLRLFITSASAFDAAWTKAREAIVEKQREWEPSRAPVTPEDFTAALRRARYR